MSAIVEKVHREAISSPVAYATEYLRNILSRELVAYIVNVDVKTISRWANQEIVRVQRENEQRLRTAFEITLLLTVFEAPAVVRAWFIGLNPELNDESPADAIRKNRLQEALAAARAFATGG